LQKVTGPRFPILKDELDAANATVAAALTTTHEAEVKDWERRVALGEEEDAIAVPGSLATLCGRVTSLAPPGVRTGGAGDERRERRVGAGVDGGRLYGGVDGFPGSTSSGSSGGKDGGLGFDRAPKVLRSDAEAREAKESKRRLADWEAAQASGSGSAGGSGISSGSGDY
jgi:hypothetical protein